MPICDAASHTLASYADVILNACVGDNPHIDKGKIKQTHIENWLSFLSQFQNYNRDRTDTIRNLIPNRKKLYLVSRNKAFGKCKRKFQHEDLLGARPKDPTSD